MLRNLTDAVWTVHPEGEEAKPVRPAQAFAVRAATIDFGTAKGSIQQLP